MGLAFVAVIQPYLHWLLTETILAYRRQAQAASFLSQSARRAQAEGQALLQKKLASVIAVYGACTDCLGPPAGTSKDECPAYVELPIQNLLFDGKEICLLDYSEFSQGVGSLCME